MPNPEAHDEEQVQKDEKTAKFLHKIAENGKERGIPECLVAFYEKKAWESANCDEKHTSCEKCGMAPPPFIEFVEKLEPTKKCRNCGEINRNLIGIQSEIVKNQVVQKKRDEQSKKSLKRNSNADTPSVPAPKIVKEKPRKVVQQPQSNPLIPGPSAVSSPLSLTSKSAAKRAAEKQKRKILVKNDEEPRFLQSFMKPI